VQKRKGFTLVELLVVIVILGIITGISIPLIRRVSQNLTEKKYLTYMDSIKQSTKLFVDSYTEDLFGHEKTGCAIIQYSQLEEKGLLKDFQEDNITCNSKETFVRVVKIDDKYGYVVSLGCGGKKSDGTIKKIDVKYPEEDVTKELCGKDAPKFGFTFTPDYYSEHRYQGRNITVTLTSSTGIGEDVEILYNFSTAQDEAHLLNSNWEKLPITIEGGNKQKKLIEDGNYIEINSEQIQTPKGYTGDLYVVLKVKKLTNLFGSTWTPEELNNGLIFSGNAESTPTNKKYYRLDNTKPTISAAEIVSGSNEYNNLTPSYHLLSTDNYSSASELKVCFSLNHDTCSKEVKDIKDGIGYMSYKKDISGIGTPEGDSVLPIAFTASGQIADSYNGQKYTVYATVADLAGNYQTVSREYQLPYQIIYNANGRKGTMTPSYCAPGATCGLKQNEFEPNSRNEEFAGWSLPGGGAFITSVTASSNVTVYANWKEKPKAVIFCLDKTYNGSLQQACTCSGGTIGGEYAAVNAGAHVATCVPDNSHSDANPVSWNMAILWTWKGYYHSTSGYDSPYKNHAQLVKCYNNQSSSCPRQADSANQKCNKNCKSLCGNAYNYAYCNHYLSTNPNILSTEGAHCWCGQG